MTNDANKIDKETIESVLNKVKRHCSKIGIYECKTCEFSEVNNSGLQCNLGIPIFWDTKKIAEVLSDETDKS